MASKRSHSYFNLMILLFGIKPINYLFSPKREYNIDCERDSMILNNSAVKNELTLKPPTIPSHNNIIKALIINRKKPSVINVIGNVKITKIGLIKILSNPSTIATNNAVVKLSK